MKNLKLSVIICTYNRADLLRGALQTLGRGQTLPAAEYEIVVVDDGSPDHTEATVQSLELDCSLRFFRIDHGGRAVARNKGIAEARGQYVLFVDDDILAPTDLLAGHYRQHVRHPRSVVRGPIINVTEYRIPQDRTTTWRDYSSAFFCTCNASVSLDALRAVGGFDENFVEYGFEDNEIGWRLREHRQTMRFDMSACVFHYKPNLGREDLAEMVQRAQELGRSAVAYYRKHPHWKVALATGLHPLLRWWNRLQANAWLYNYCLREWNAKADRLTPSRRAFLEGRIFRYHYLRSLENERRRQAAGTPDRTPSPPKGGATVFPRHGEASSGEAVSRG